jgi:hypothetical protein
MIAAIKQRLNNLLWLPLHVTQQVEHTETQKQHVASAHIIYHNMLRTH